MLLTAGDVEGGALQVDIGNDGLLVNALPQAALEAWRTLHRPDGISSAIDSIGVAGPQCRAFELLPAADIVGAMRVALYLGKGVAECARVLDSVARAPDFGRALDADVAAFLSDPDDAQAAHMRHEMFMHQPGPIAELRWLRGSDVPDLCAHFGVGESALLARMARDDARLRVQTPLDDGGGVVARALAAQPFQHVDVEITMPHESGLDVLDALGRCARPYVAAVSVRTDVRSAPPSISSPYGSGLEDVLQRAVAAVSQITGLQRLHLLNTNMMHQAAAETLTALSSLTALTQLYVYTVPQGFSHPALRSLGLRTLEATSVALPELRTLRAALDVSAAPGLPGLTQLERLSVDFAVLNSERSGHVSFHPRQLAPLVDLRVLQIRLKDRNCCQITSQMANRLARALRGMTRLEVLSIMAGGLALMHGGGLRLLASVRKGAAHMRRLHTIRLPHVACLSQDGAFGVSADAAKALKRLAADAHVACVREVEFDADGSCDAPYFAGLPDGVHIVRDDGLESLFPGDHCCS